MTKEEEFIKYTNPYKKYGEKIDLKIHHTFRVQKLCIEIAKSQNLSNEDIELASTCGLLHDIGRFEQWKRYKSYNDLISLDHGDLGVDILKENNFINKFTNSNKDTILRAVKYHNKYKVPNTLSKRNIYFTNITRDADKIDILYLFVTGGLVTKTENTKMTNKIFKSVLNKQLIRKKDAKTKADEIAIRLGFVFDLNFKKSYEIIKEKDYINKMLKIQIEEAENKELINQLNELQVFINKYIEEMIKC